MDSNSLNAFIDRRKPLAARARAARLRGDRIGTCEVVVAEMYYGIELSSSRDANRARLDRALGHVVTWPFDRRASREYGRLAAELRRRGRPMQTIDVMLAAIALNLGDCIVVSTDSDLSAVPGLSVENWMASDAGVVP